MDHKKGSTCFFVSEKQKLKQLLSAREPLEPACSRVVCELWAVKPGQPTSSSSSLASSWVDTSSRPCGFAFAGAGSICSRRASPGPAELRRTGTPDLGGIKYLCRCSGEFGAPVCAGASVRAGLLGNTVLLKLILGQLSLSVRHSHITDIRNESTERREGVTSTHRMTNHVA